MLLIEEHTVLPVRLTFARFWPGFQPESFIRRYLRGLEGEFRFEVADDAPFLIYGPYENRDAYCPDIPPGNRVRILWQGENYPVDMRECDWAFSYHLDEEVRDPRHYHALAAFSGLDDGRLVKASDFDAQAEAANKTGFCNFIYGNRVPFREEFVRLLSQYKKVDCPGRALNNMPGFDREGDDYLQRENNKKEFVRRYKFTIAFENSTSLGYTTEKLWQPMLSSSIPIYWGNPQVGKMFNTCSFINVHELVSPPAGLCRGEFTPRFHDPKDIANRWTLANRAVRKVNGLIRARNMELWRRADLQAVVDRIVELDRNADAYARVLGEPWLPGNRVPDMSGYWNRWREIFAKGLDGRRHPSR